jgi:glycosyltransferase involved in cell wall biosynthesis
LNSLYEGLSHVLIEAMTLGTPVIATDAGGNTTLISHGETGLLVSPGDDASLEQALVAVESDPTAAEARALRAQKHMGDFSVPHMLDATAQLLNSL